MTYRRINYSETKKLKPYGLAGDDTFEMWGRVHKDIKVTLVGGAGRDVLQDTSRVGGWGKNVSIDGIEQIN